ncbi:UNVERIFIED_CONTAM: hypothetical protein FKN15_072222 [Acipenser sinensis]
MRKHESGNRKRSLEWMPDTGKLEVNVTVDSEHLRMPSFNQGIVVVTMVCKAPVQKLQYSTIVGACCDQSNHEPPLVEIEFVMGWIRL